MSEAPEGLEQAPLDWAQERDALLLYVLEKNRHLLRLPKAGMDVSEAAPFLCIAARFCRLPTARPGSIESMFGAAA